MNLNHVIDSSDRENDSHTHTLTLHTVPYLYNVMYRNVIINKCNIVTCNYECHMAHGK